MFGEGFTLSSNDWVSLGAILWVGIMAKATRTETRTLLLAVLGAVLTGNPYVVVVVGVLALLFKLVDVIKIGG